VVFQVFVGVAKQGLEREVYMRCLFISAFDIFWFGNTAFKFRGVFEPTKKGEAKLDRLSLLQSRLLVGWVSCCFNLCSTVLQVGG
jgi:hypothetical protein